MRQPVLAADGSDTAGHYGPRTPMAQNPLGRNAPTNPGKMPLQAAQYLTGFTSGEPVRTDPLLNCSPKVGLRNQF